MPKLKWVDQKSHGKVIGSNLDVLGGRNVCVHNWMGCGDQDWFLTFEPFFSKHELEAKTLEKAKVEGVRKARAALCEALESITPKLDMQSIIERFTT